MSFVDRLLQDMLHRNMSGKGAARMARKAARRIGTRRLLMMGGAALAGGLLTEAARRQGAAERQATPGAAADRAAPPLPPVPGGAGTAGAPPSLPPLPVPGGAGETPTAAAPGLELPPDTLYAALRTMVAAALADGELSAQERALIERRLAESDLSEERVAQVRRDLVLPPTPAELAALLPAGEPPELLLDLAMVVARADSGVSAHESAWLRQLAGALGVAESRLDELQRELHADD
ncbi:MAG TPA: DUF533 domain-containing protein [Thermoanaerobaculia bacterium]|nr:DUF533 domain-containing protein [Thermoanaerobaculia bacterium]